MTSKNLVDLRQQRLRRRKLRQALLVVAAVLVPILSAMAGIFRLPQHARAKIHTCPVGRKGCQLVRSTRLRFRWA